MEKVKYYKILDKNGSEMPHYTGEFKPYTDYQRAKKMLDKFNLTGEYAPYTLVETTDKD